MTKPLTSGQLLRQKFVRDRSAVAGLVILLGLVITAVLAPYLALFPEDVSATHPATRLQAPSWEHPFGTDTLGRDVYSRVLYGGRITLVISLTVVGACLLIGVPAGLIAGYCDNMVGDAVMRLADIFLAVPRVILALALSQALGPSLPNMLLALTITYWPWFARTVAAETRSVKHSTFIEASEARHAAVAYYFLSCVAECVVADYRAQLCRHGFYDSDGGGVGIPGRRGPTSGTGVGGDDR
jgi:peptide/nickel transport system permease protein